MSSTVISCISDDDGLFTETFPSGVLPLGRKNEMMTLENAYDRVSMNHSFEKVIIHGESGTGKTTLAMSVQDKVLKDGGFFCSGKYFPNSDFSQDPFSAIMAAFSDLCDLMLQSDHCDDEHRAGVKAELGPDAKFLINVVTNISPFLVGDGAEKLNQSNEMMYSCAFASFKIACKAFLRAMSSDEHPIVLFIDDIQWMDEGSKELVKSLLHDTSMSNLLLILSYRDEDSFYLDDILPRKSETCSDIQVGNFDFECVHDMLFTKLGLESNNAPTDMNTLCSLIVNKTHGNPFHVVQFLEAIQSAELLSFEAKSSTWMCNIERVQKETMISDSLADLIAKKVTRLNSETQTLLKAMSLSPCRFTEDVLLILATKILARVVVGENSPSIVLRALLRKAIQEEMIEDTCDGYQFSHDKIRAEFEGMIDERERENLHLVLGRIFLAKSNDHAKYLAAVHLNCVTALMISSEEDKVTLAQANLEASKYCQDRFSFEAARSFLQKGLALLEGERKWTKNFHLSFEMTRLLARLESVGGNLDSCLSATSDLLIWAKSPHETTIGLMIEIDARISSYAIDDGAKEGRKVLRIIGFHTPIRMTPFHLYFKLKKVRKLLDGKQDDGILGLLDPKLDTSTCNVQKLLSRIVLYFLQRKAFLLSIYTMLLVVEHAMSIGLSPHSLISFAYLGALESCFGKNERASRIGNLVRKLASLQGRSTNADVASCFAKIFICFREETIRHGIHRFTPEDVDSSFQNGDLLLNQIVFEMSFFIRFWGGENLESLETSLREVYYRIRELGQTKLLVHFHPLLQVILNLRDRDHRLEDLVVVTGEIMDEEEFLRSIDDVMHLKILFLVLKTILAYTLGFYEKAEEVFCKLSRSTPIRKDKFYFAILFNFYGTMIYYARYHETGRGRYICKARKHKSFIQHCHSLGIPDANILLRIFEIEEACIRKSDVVKICELFDSVINYLPADGFNNLKALANERAYYLLNKLGYREVSKSYLEKVVNVCKEWHATAKHEWALREYSGFCPVCSTVEDLGSTRR